MPFSHLCRVHDYSGFFFSAPHNTADYPCCCSLIQLPLIIIFSTRMGFFCDIKCCWLFLLLFTSTYWLHHLLMWSVFWKRYLEHAVIWLHTTLLTILVASHIHFCICDSDLFMYSLTFIYLLAFIKWLFLDMYIDSSNAMLLTILAAVHIHFDINDIDLFVAHNATDVLIHCRKQSF